MELKYMTTAGTLSMKAGVFTGVANRASVLDYGSDVVEPMAWTKGGSSMSVPLLAQHDHGSVIGRVALREDASVGLVVTKGQFADGVRLADDYRKLVEGGFLDGMSVGYSVQPGGERYERGVRYLSALKLHEVSLVTFPMNTLSRVTSISDGKQLAEVVGMLRRMRLDMPIRHDADESAAEQLAALLSKMNEEASAGSMLALVRRMRKEVTR